MRGPHDLPYEVAFVGRWLVWPEEWETRTREPGYDAGAYYSEALTQRGNIAVYVRHVNDGFAPILKTYSNFEGAGARGYRELFWQRSRQRFPTATYRS